jgi:hypothetical protein
MSVTLAATLTTGVPGASATERFAGLSCAPASRGNPAISPSRTGKQAQRINTWRVQMPLPSSISERWPAQPGGSGRTKRGVCLLVCLAAVVLERSRGQLPRRLVEHQFQATDMAATDACAFWPIAIMGNLDATGWTLPRHS